MNKGGDREEYNRTNKQVVWVIGQTGLSMDGWPDEVMERSRGAAAREPAAKPRVGVSQAEEQQPSPGSVRFKLPH